jgi:ribosomal protein L16/L10AE
MELNMDKITLPGSKQIGHLRLIRQPRDLSLAEYRKLSSVDQLEIVRLASGKQKLDLIIEARQPQTIVSQLHPQELYLTVAELGAESADELIKLANTEQITTCIDLDCWDDDQLSPVLSLRWLELLLNCGETKICELIKTIEPEILALFLQKHLKIIRGIEAYDDDDAENARRMEGLYDIDYYSEDATKIIGALIKIWQELAQEDFLLIMEMTRSESLSILQEEVFLARNIRLIDLGIIPKSEAKNLYMAIAPEAITIDKKNDFRIESEGFGTPTGMLSLAKPGNLLAAILADGLDHETACELMMLANRKMSADDVDVSSTTAIKESLQEVFDILNLGLEFLAPDDTIKAAELFHNSYLLQLFQVGYNLLRQEKVRGKKLSKSAIYPFLDYPEMLFLDSFMQQPASLYHAASGEQVSYLAPVKSMAELQFVRTRMSQLEALNELFSNELPFSLPEVFPEEEAPCLSGLLMTAVANQLLGRSFGLEPLDIDSMIAIKEKADQDPLLSHKLLEELRKTTLNAPENISFFLEFAQESWDDFFDDFGSDSDELPFEGFLLTK